MLLILVLIKCFKIQKSKHKLFLITLLPREIMKKYENYNFYYFSWKKNQPKISYILLKKTLKL